MTDEKNIHDLRKLHEKMKAFVHQTPVLTSRSFNNFSGTEAYFKCENFQKMGAFKMRGALNAALHLNDDQKAKGVVTHSSGNFGQATALAAKLLNISATVIMPENAPQVKKDAVKAYGARVIECKPGQANREKAVEEFIAGSGAILLHPSNQIEVIEGNATVALEFLEEIPGLEIMITPVGGGGLLAGTAMAAKLVNPGIEIIGAEPSQVDDAYWSLKKGIIQPPTNKETIADGLKTSLGDINFPVIQKHVKSIIRVEEEEIIFAMKWIWERMKVVVEASSAVAVAAVLKEKELFRDKKTGIILSGGNVELEKLPFGK